MTGPGWQAHAQGAGEFLVVAPDRTQYEVAAHLEATQSPIPENGVVIDRITSGGVVLHDGRAIRATFDAQVTMTVEAALLDGDGRY